MLSAQILFLGLGVLSGVRAQNKSTLPSLLGPYPVSITSYELHTERWDDLAPTTEKRKLMLSIFQPLTRVKSCPVPTTYIPYMPPKTTDAWGKFLHNLVPSLPANIPNRIQIANCDAADNETTSSESPLLIFSPGASAARQLYDSYNQAFASSGYTVVSIDHTYDSLLVEFTDGSNTGENTVWSWINESTPVRQEAALAPFIPTRAADMSSVLDAIQNATIPGLEAYSTQPVKAIAYGQSLGGNTAVAAVERDSRFIGMMDWGGNLWDPWVRNTNISIPTAFQASQARWDSGHLAETWNNNLWPLLNWSVAFGINGTQHVSVTDVPLILDVLNLRSEVVNESFGTISGERLLNVTWSHGLSFFNFVTNGTTPTLLEGPSSEYPDVFFIKEPGQKSS